MPWPWIFLGVTLVGDFTREPPREAQLDSTVRLVAQLCRMHDIPPAAVAFHRDLGTMGTTCPGGAFPEEQFRERLEDVLQE